MGLFSKKEKVTASDVAKDMVLVGLDTAGKMEAFNDLDAQYSMAVNLGYFYGFLKMSLISVTNLETTNTIIMQSIGELEKLVQEKVWEEFGYNVRTMYNNANENIKYASEKLKDNPIKGMGLLYYIDLHKSTTLNMDKMGACEKNMQLLYAKTSGLFKNIKIVK